MSYGDTLMRLFFGRQKGFPHSPMKNSFRCLKGGYKKLMTKGR